MQIGGQNHNDPARPEIMSGVQRLVEIEDQTYFANCDFWSRCLDAVHGIIVVVGTIAIVRHLDPQEK